jgi:asparagine synthase (glutamine-hydrolysing)
MCAIAGVYAYHYAANAVDVAELIRIRDHMAARGPDGKGAWIAENGRVGLAHRRLSIIDLTDAGAQPMTSEDGRLIVTFNGEIYNYRELRADLERRGRRFRTRTDTEVLLHLFAEKGEAMVEDLRGMFAFAIFDTARERLFLARDPYGVKPAYYCDDGWTFRFASQVKALLAGGRVSTDPEPAGHVGFHLWGNVPEPFTLFRHIRALPAGSTLVVDRIGARAPRRYHSIAAVYRTAEATRVDEREAPERVRAALLDSVRHHLVADVPVGAFLSGGVDSGALLGLMRELGQDDIETVTIAFEEFVGRADDEAPLAAEVARAYGVRHSIRVVTAREFEDDLPRIIDAMDQPSIDGVNSWFVAKAARELGLKVAVTGLGGDELFGGYSSFRAIPASVRLLGVPSRVPGLGRAFRILAATAARRLHPKAAGVLEFGGGYAGAYLLKRGLFMPWELTPRLDPEILARGLRRLAPLRAIDAELTPRPRAPFSRVATLESSFYMRNQLLRDMDWASMAHSLEVRTPFVDSALLAQVAPFTLRRPLDGKRLLAEAPARPLPRAVATRAKTGFLTPVAGWMTDRVRSAASAKTAEPWARQWSSLVWSWTKAAEESVAT